jgi:hypothetical protein
MEGVPLTPLDWSADLFLPSFESYWGTLNSVEVLLNLTQFTGQLTVTNPTSVAKDVTVYARVYSVLEIYADSLIDGLSLGTTDINGATIAPGDIVTLDFQDSDYKSMFFQTPGQVSSFVDNNMIRFEIQEYTANLVAIDGAIVANPESWIIDSNLMSATEVSIEYTFTPNPVPEPSTMLLLGSGLIMIAAHARRRTDNGVI